MKVMVVDDEESVADALRLLIEGEGYTVEVYTSLASAEVLADRDDLFLTILDHDFSAVAGEETVGYVLASQLKTGHWAKHALPIIYLSGRETAAGYVARRRENMRESPDQFVSKDELASHPDVMLDLLSEYDDYLDELQATVDEHGVERTLGIFGGWGR